MEKQLWINLPVKDVSKSKEFFAKLGFSFNLQYPDNSDSACLFAGGNKVIIMLFREPLFRSFTGNEVADTKQTTEVLFSLDAESREEVDEMARKAQEAGGTVYGTPGEKGGWMYGCGFTDLDGHRWNILYRDMSRVPERKNDK